MEDLNCVACWDECDAYGQRWFYIGQSMTRIRYLLIVDWKKKKTTVYGYDDKFQMSEKPLGVVKENLPDDKNSAEQLIKEFLNQRGEMNHG